MGRKRKEIFDAELEWVEQLRVETKKPSSYRNCPELETIFRRRTTTARRAIGSISIVDVPARFETIKVRFRRTSQLFRVRSRRLDPGLINALFGAMW